jgi:phosphatidylinositol phospholipase C, delta
MLRIDFNFFVVDIFDGDPISEPMIYHGKTLTTKVPLRDVCLTIAKYGFVASPYPIIISAEMYCSVSGQDAVAAILKEAFGDKLVSAPVDEDGMFLTRLPSPERLKGRILFKTKNLDLLVLDSSGQGSEFEDTSTTDPSSTSESEMAFEFRAPMSSPDTDAEVIKGEFTALVTSSSL